MNSLNRRFKIISKAFERDRLKKRIVEDPLIRESPKRYVQKEDK